MAKARTMVAAGLALALATPLAAKQAEGPEGAETLEARAERLAEGDVGQWAKAAELLRRAAELRPAADPQAVSNLMRAGKLFYYTGKRERAVRVLEQAGERAMAYGDVINAATAFLDAGWVANVMGDGARAYALGSKGARLLDSPLIEASVRAELQRRVMITSVS